MGYITLIMQCLQQQLQRLIRYNQIIPNILTSREGAIRKIDIILDGPIPGGTEQTNYGFCDDVVDEDQNEIECVNKISVNRNNFNRKVNNIFISNNRRP